MKINDGKGEPKSFIRRLANATKDASRKEQPCAR